MLYEDQNRRKSVIKYDFTLKETDGNDVSLKDYRGKNVVVYFYPKDNTPGWITEAQEFMEFHKEFEKLNTVILGISKDGLKSHEKFRDKYKIPFLLLSDESKKVHEIFHVMKPKKLYGKEYLGVERSTFVFDTEGNLVQEYRKVKVKGHAEEVLNFIKSMEENN